MKILKYILCALCVAGALTSCSDDDDNAITPAPAPDAKGSWTDDRDGTEYQWVRYGKLEWTVQNLSYQTAAGATMPDLNVSPSYYDDGVGTKYYQTFGMLYNYDAAVAAVPDGWRLPTRSDWDDLADRTGGDIMGAISLQLGGYYLNDEYFQRIHPNVDYYAYIYGFYWTSTVDDSKATDAYAFYRKLTYNIPGSVCDSMDKTNYLNVRLVRDAK